MQCPLCQKELVVIGDQGGQCHSSEFKRPIGWDCLTYVKDDIEGAVTPHYSVRGARATAILYPFRIDTWCTADEVGVSTVYHFGRFGWEKVWSCPAISLEHEEKLLARLKLLLVFS